MRVVRYVFLFGVCLLVLAIGVPALSPVTVAVAQEGPKAAATTAFTGGRSWVGHEKELEDYLKSAEVTKIEDLSVGVTHPKKAYLAPGGLVDLIAWKPLKPGIYSGFFESYKAEIAAYEIDKLLGLGMVPPTVEKRVKGDLGAAIMWISPTKSFKELGGVPNPPGAKLDVWNKQLIKAKMFDNLIANKDPNLGNWLIDPDWNVVLIDHSRALQPGKDLTHVMTRIDADLWDKMKKLDDATLMSAMGACNGGCLKEKEVKSILERREKMQQVIDKLVAEKGDAAVMVR